MTYRARVFALYAGTPGDTRDAELVDETIDLPRPQGDQLIAEPLYGCWAGNMTHALQRRPADICRQRNEPKVVLGNSGVVRVLDVGPDVRDLRPGQLCLLFSASVLDAYGYPIKAFAYDAPGTMGCLATRMLLRAHELLALPDGTRHDLARWAAFSGASITAWSNWELAFGTLRLQLHADELPAPHVWGWGGGTTLATLDLARRHGCRAVQLSADPGRRALIERAGVTALARDQFPALAFDEPRFASDLAYRRAYLDSEAAFLREVERRTGGEGVHVFVDYIGQPVWRATLKALARQGVVTTAGWKLGMSLGHLRAAECIARHQFIHTHFARRSQGLAAVAYAEAHDWLPEVDPPVAFDRVPELARAHADGRTGFYPIFAVNPP
ncbi:zinc-binding dehydrogenase [Nannocystis sp. SCPEA4]|uniref:zinc-binding dehydrogenase n=1 Tax=Nannocystis sp. SCPEA4 TaxID=2996787 RepID=UPI00226F799D|nr:zinc-binding dehydrogenase [Nannocystis sp. SCPEA4]MCY1057571.1 zinc-binding dehydrogenase [Nannocystis sp. SCPEA4]